MAARHGPALDVTLTFKFCKFKTFETIRLTSVFYWLSQTFLPFSISLMMLVSRLYQANLAKIPFSSIFRLILAKNSYTLQFHLSAKLGNLDLNLHIYLKISYLRRGSGKVPIPRESKDNSVYQVKFYSNYLKKTASDNKMTWLYKICLVFLHVTCSM